MPYYSDIPDLSNWKAVSEFRVIEAALLFAGIDPFDHERFVIHGDIKLNHPRLKLFLGIERAIVTAISQGTLQSSQALVRLWDDNSGDTYTTPYDQFKHSWDDIDVRKTTVTRASLFPWAEKIKLDYARPLRRPAIEIESEEIDYVLDQPPLRPNIPDVTIEHATPPLLIENKPGYIDPENPFSPIELRAAHDCWLAITKDGNPRDQGKAVRDAAKEWLEAHRSEYSDLSNEAIGRIATVTNWDKKGGAPRTPTKPTHPVNPHKT